MKRLLYLLTALPFACSLQAQQNPSAGSGDVAIENPAQDNSAIIQELSAEEMDYYGLTPESRLPIRAGLDFQGFYDSNIFISQNNEVDDFIWEVDPFIAYESSDPSVQKEHYLLVKYDPKIQIFTYNSDQDNADQSGVIDYKLTGDKGTFEFFSHNYENSGADRDVGTRTDRVISDSKISGTYDLTGKMSLEMGVAQILRFYERQSDFHTWYGESYLLYEVLPKLKLGFGPKVGWVDIGNGPNQSFQQGLVRAIYNPTEKLTFNGSVGFEVREFQDGSGEGDRVTPAASLGLTWTPFDGTSVTMSGYRSIESSTSLAATNYAATGMMASIRQRFFQKFYYTLGGGYENDDYYATKKGTASNREDDYWNIRNELSYDFIEWASASIYYKYQDNDSNVAGFVDHQAGFSLSVEY